MHYNELIYNHFQHLNSPKDGEGESQFDFRPLYSIRYEKKEELRKWLSDTLEALQLEAGPRTENQFRNIMFYKGIHTLSKNQEIRAETYDNQPISMENRFVMNHILEFTQQKQARLMRYSPTINVFPWNNTYADRLGARLGKKIIDSAFYIHRFEDLLQQVTLEAAICGESFLFFEWDKYAGDIDPEVEAAEQRAKIFGDFVNEDGEKIDLKSIERVGDHKIDTPLPFQVLHQPKAKWKDVDYVFKATIKHIDEVRAENQLDQAALDEIDRRAAVRNYKAGHFEDFGRNVVQWEFYHRRHRFVPNGFYAKFFDGVILSMGELPYSHGGLPCVRFTDYDDPTNAHGRSFYESLKLPSVMINNMMKIAYRSFAIAAYPKLIMQEGSCNMYSMANGPFVVEVTPGALEPKIVSFNAVNRDFFPLSEHVERFMEKNSGTFGISRGEQLPNARARSILNFYEEQEQERESTQIRKFSAFIEKSAKMILANSADFYKPDDGRTIKVVGKNNTYKLIKVTEETKLSSDWNVKVQRTTALSESKQGRIDQISTLSTIPLADQESPGLFTREQILSMIEVADTSTFFEMATASAERAHSENEDLFEGRDVAPPQEYQAHLVDWNVHFHWIQSREFSETDGVPEEVRTKTLEHLAAHEMFLYNKAKTNFALANVLASNKYFPAVFQLSPQDLPLSQILILLQQPPMPPMAPQPPQGTGDAGAPIPEDEFQGDVPLPDEIPQPDAAIPPDAMTAPDNLPVA